MLVTLLEMLFLPCRPGGAQDGARDPFSLVQLPPIKGKNTAFNLPSLYNVLLLSRLFNSIIKDAYVCKICVKSFKIAAVQVSTSKQRVC